MVYTFKQFLFLLLLLNYVIWVSCVCSPEVACFPGRLDVTASSFTQSSIYASSTCGTPKETFCSISNCSLVCDATNPLLSHPKSLMIDKFDGNTYWKSKNLEAPVTIRLDLQQKLILHQVVTTFQFDVASAVYLDRSQDFGKTYTRLVHFALNCVDKFGLKPQPISQLYKGTNAVCITITQSDISTKKISYMPRTDATIAREVLRNSLIRDHFIFTNLKFVLFDYQKPASFNKNTADPRKFFFSVKDFDVQGSCYCNGMSDQCNATNYGNCNCQKNTAGNNCEKCLPLFNNKAWEYGIACQECNCSNLARSCSYDAAKGHGVCQNCTKNTSGDFCQDCLSGFHRNANQTCVDCGCNASGVNSTGRTCNQRTGVCNCKLNVQGSKCSSCKPFFWGLTASDGNGCQACGCRTAVTVNGSGLCDAITGQCACMPGFTGRTCDTCQVGNHSVNLQTQTVCTLVFVFFVHSLIPGHLHS